MAKNTEDGKKRGFLSNLLHPGQNKTSGEPTKKEATIIPATPKAAPKTTKPKAEAVAKTTKTAAKPAVEKAVEKPLSLIHI